MVFVHKFVDNAFGSLARQLEGALGQEVKATSNRGNLNRTHSEAIRRLSKAS